jgi:hypothetical protein
MTGPRNPSPWHVPFDPRRPPVLPLPRRGLTARALIARSGRPGRSAPGGRCDATSCGATPKVPVVIDGAITYLFRLRPGSAGPARLRPTRRAGPTGPAGLFRRGLGQDAGVGAGARFLARQQASDLDPRGEHKPFRVSIRTAAAELVRTGAGLAFPPPSAVPTGDGTQLRSLEPGRCPELSPSKERPDGV